MVISKYLAGVTQAKASLEITAPDVLAYSHTTHSFTSVGGYAEHDA